MSRTRSRSSVLLEFLGSMNLAITLLVAIAIASVVGTVLQQNQAYQDYIIKFGPFWFDVFNRLGLFDVYSASWFLLILTFLVISTSVCIYRNTPHMLHDMRSYRTGVQRKSLSAFHSHREWKLELEPERVDAILVTWLKANGYRFRLRDEADYRLLAGMKGSISRLGYLFTHVAIVVICVGALFDGNLPLKLRELNGQLKPEIRDLPASEVPSISRMPVDNPSFRGSVRVPEGTSANVVFLQLRDGFLVQPLPFPVEVKDFRIEHYPTGQPKSFESDLVVHDPDLPEPLTATIAVNHPLIYKGYAIYQASFSDGGTGLELKAWPLHSADNGAEELTGKVFDSLQVDTEAGSMTLEFTDFRMFNINPVIGEDGREQQKNFGPSFTYRLRNAEGRALEYENYMLPVEFDGRMFYLGGVRESVADSFHYLHIPVDPAGGVERFQRFNARLYDDERVLAVAQRTTDLTFGKIELDKPEMRDEVVSSMQRLVARFRSGGFDNIEALVRETVPEDKQEEVTSAYLKVLQTVLAEIYVELLQQEGVDLDQGMSEFDAQYFDEVLSAVSGLGAYGSPFYLQLDSYEFVQASGLQITRAPGKNVVYMGFALLTAGVFLMFYVPARRIWFWQDAQDATVRLLVAGTGNRHQRDFEQEFEKLCNDLERQWQAAEDQA